MASGKNRHDHQFRIPQETLTEVLSWLLAKSLTRFKSVSKHWLSLITDDPTFAEMYKSRKRAPLFALFPPFCYSICHCWDGHFFVMDTDTNHNPRIHNSPSIVTETYGTLFCTINRVTNIVDGLLCFYHSYFDGGFMNLYNLATCETLPLHPPTPRVPVYGKPFCSRRCFLGFDPNKMEYKVIHFYTAVYNDFLNGEVLTLGGGHRWRPIVALSTYSRLLLPIKKLREPGICLDGVIYWMSISRDEMKIVGFNVEQETFAFIKAPVKASSIATIAQIGEDIALVDIDMHFMMNEITLWRKKDPKFDHTPMWDMQVISCPFFNNYGWSPVRCTDFGVVFVVRSSTSDQFTVESYDLATGRQGVLQINNNARERFVLNSGFCPLRVDEKYIMPLKNIMGRSLQL